MRKLYRSRKDRVLTGLCGGIAEWMGASPTFIRLATVIAALFSFGSVLLIYFLCSLFVPSEPHVPPFSPHHFPSQPQVPSFSPYHYPHNDYRYR
jgi:phage shock protein PspC (stress-responsive transcriptional regulator)